jgi:pyrophosphatase PpaX
MPVPRALVFDLDGTLIDSIRLIIDSYHHTLATHGLPARTDEDWLAGIGTPLRTQFASCCPDDETMERFIATYREFNLAHHDRYVTVYAGVTAMMDELRRRHVPMALVTSKNRNGALRGLGLAGFADCFSCLVCADDVQNPKPHPEPVHRALEQLGTDPASTVFIGDSLHDMAAGRAAGVQTGAVLWGPFDRPHLEAAAPDHWLEHPADVLGLFGQP